MTIIDGKKVADQITEAIKEELKVLKQKPQFHCLLVGSDPASLLYIKRKQEYAEAHDIDFHLHQLPSGATKDEVLNLVSSLNMVPNGFIVQLPLPEHLESDTNEILQAIDSTHDADGLTLKQREAVLSGEKGLIATPVAAVFALLNSLYSDINLKDTLPFSDNYSGAILSLQLVGKRAVVISDGDVFGDNLANLLTKAGLQTTVRDSASCVLGVETLTADVVITALGQPGFLTGDMLTRGAIVIDIGTTLVNGKTVGDVDWESVQDVAGAATPVPGGVGPVTVAMLYANLLALAKKYA